MSLFQSIQNYFNPQTEVTTVLPSGETIYENNYSKKVLDNYQGVMDYRYAQALNNQDGYLMPQYDRTAIYDKNNPTTQKKLLQMANQSSLFQTNLNGNAEPQVREAGIVYSELTGLPMTEGTDYLKGSIPRKLIQQANMDNVENPPWARKMELFGNNDMYQEKKVSKWSDFNKDIPGHVNGLPIYSEYNLERAKDTFKIGNEMTNVLPTPQIRVPRRIDGEIRAIPKSTNEQRSLSNQKVSGGYNKNFEFNLNASESVSALPHRYAPSKDLYKKQVTYQDIQRNHYSKENVLYSTTQGKPTKKEKMLFQYKGNEESAVAANNNRDGLFSKNTPNRIMFLNYQGLADDNTGKFIDNREFHQLPNRNFKAALAGRGQFLEKQPPKETVTIKNAFGMVSHNKNKRVYQNRPLFGLRDDTNLDVWKPNLQHKRHNTIINKRLYN